MSFCLRLLSFKAGESGVVLNTIVALGKEDAGRSIGINGKKAPESFGLLGFSNFTGLKVTKYQVIYWGLKTLLEEGVVSGGVSGLLS